MGLPKSYLPDGLTIKVLTGGKHVVIANPI